MKYPKFGVPVKVTFDGGTKEFGVVFVRQNQRVIDVLSDERPFIPFKTKDRTTLINKSRILQVDLMEETEIAGLIDVLPALDLDYLAANSW